MEQIIQSYYTNLLYKVLNLKDLIADWLTLNLTQTVMSRQTKFIAMRSNNFKVGNNLLCNRLTIMNRQIKLDGEISPRTSKNKLKE